VARVGNQGVRRRVEGPERLEAVIGAGTCLAEDCSNAVWPDPRPGFENAVRAFCETHSRERDLEIEARNVAGDTANVLQLSEYRGTIE
jgi:hypothetical protein